jgi:hypothetical protein
VRVGGTIVEIVIIFSIHVGIRFWAERGRSTMRETYTEVDCFNPEMPCLYCGSQRPSRSP